MLHSRGLDNARLKRLCSGVQELRDVTTVSNYLSMLLPRLSSSCRVTMKISLSVSAMAVYILVVVMWANVCFMYAEAGKCS